MFVSHFDTIYNRIVTDRQMDGQMDGRAESFLAYRYRSLHACMNECGRTIKLKIKNIGYK